jgi:hypothetical protein
MSSLLVFNRVCRLEIQSVSFVSYCPYNLLSGSPPPPLPLFQKSKYNYIQTVFCWVGVGGGGLSYGGDHILQKFNTLFLIRFRTSKIATPPQTKTYEGRRGFRQISTCRKVPLQVIFFYNNI